MFTKKPRGNLHRLCENRTPLIVKPSGLCLSALMLIPALLLAQEQEQAQPSVTKDGLVIEEVIVTVSKRRENLQDVLGSVSALSGELLQRNNIQDLKSLVDLIPGVVAQDEQKIAIRGISRTRDGPSPVSFHVNDFFIGSQGGNIRGEPFYDLEAIEILRGPSGTLFGRNSTAGAINAKWRRPSAEWSIGGDARYSSLEENQLRAYINIPFFGEGDRRLLGRIAAISRRGDGTIDNLLVPDDQDPNNVDDRFIRLYLTSEPTDNLQLGLRAVHYDRDPDGTLIVFSPSRETRRSGVFEELGAEPLPDDLTKVRSRVHERFGENFEEFTRVDGNIAWSLRDLPWLGDMDLELIGGEMRRDNDDVFDLDGTEVAITEGRTSRRDDIRRSAELRFVSQNDSGFDWLLGVFWSRQTLTRDLDIAVRNFIRPSELGLPELPGEPEIIVDVDVVTRDERLLDHSEAAFLNFNFDLAQLLDWHHVEITAGMRRNRDKFSLKTGRNDVFINTPFGPQPVIEQRNVNQFADSNETTGEVGVRWFYSDHGMTYLKVARGYKPGLAQVVETLDEGVIQNPVDPEFINAYELGWKSAFLQQTLQINVAAFHYDYRDLQVSQITPGGVVTENAASATINGFEVEAQWSPTAAFHLQASAAWTDATYNDFCGTDPGRPQPESPDPGCPEDGPFDFSGERLTAAPEYSAVLLARYAFSLGDFGSLTPSVKISWTDELDRRGLGNPVDEIRSHSRSDLRLTWQSRGERWKVEAFVENIEDHDDIFFQAFTPIGGRSETFTLVSNIPPRLYGVYLEVSF